MENHRFTDEVTMSDPFLLTLRGMPSGSAYRGEKRKEKEKITSPQRPPLDRRWREEPIALGEETRWPINSTEQAEAV